MMRAFAQQAAALERVYAQYAGDIYRYLYARLRSREEAEDLTADVFLKVARQLDASREEASVKAWLYQLAKTTLADHWRQRGPTPLVPLDGCWNLPEPPLVDTAPDPAKVRLLHELLEQLGERHYEVLMLRFVEGYSVRETARAMGITENHAKVLQFRAVQRAATLAARRCSSA